MKKYIDPQIKLMLVDTSDIMNTSQNVDDADPVRNVYSVWGGILGGFEQENS